MNSSEHNTTVACLHIVHGILATAMCLLLVVLGFIGSVQDGEPMIAFVVSIFAILGWAIIALPNLVAGVGLLKRRSWARVAGIISSFISIFAVPFGTLMSIYSLWFLLGAKAAKMYETNDKTASHTPSQLNAYDVYGQPFEPHFYRQTEREKVYAPPTEPPDWR